ncbi:hypothetical protein L9F63_003774, partial [Diploptera punctata]
YATTETHCPVNISFVIFFLFSLTLNSKVSDSFSLFLFPFSYKASALSVNNCITQHVAPVWWTSGVVLASGLKILGIRLGRDMSRDYRGSIEQDLDNVMENVLDLLTKGHLFYEGYVVPQGLIKEELKRPECTHFGVVNNTFLYVQNTLKFPPVMEQIGCDASFQCKRGLRGRDRRKFWNTPAALTVPVTRSSDSQLTSDHSFVARKTSFYITLL